MNKRELIDAVAVSTTVDRRVVAAVLGALTSTITRTVEAGEEVALIGFGKFERVHKPARIGRNPQTGEALEIAAKDVPAFKPFAEFKDAVAGVAKETVAA